MIVIVPILWTFLAVVQEHHRDLQQPVDAARPSCAGRTSSRAWNKAHVGRYFLNSVIVVAFSTAGTMLLGSMAAYVLARYKFCGNRFVYYLFVSGLAFPVFLALVPLFFVVKNLGLLDTYTGLVLVYIAYSLPFTVFFLAAFFKTLPTSVAEAAMIDGCVAHPAVLPGHAADGQARPDQRRDLQHHRSVGQYLLPWCCSPAPRTSGCSPRASPTSRSAPATRRTGPGCSPR